MARFPHTDAGYEQAAAHCMALSANNPYMVVWLYVWGKHFVISGREPPLGLLAPGTCIQADQNGNLYDDLTFEGED